MKNSTSDRLLMVGHETTSWKTPSGRELYQTDRNENRINIIII